MKLWEILKAENVGKKYEDNKNRTYILKLNDINEPTLYDDLGFCPAFTQYEVMNLEFELNSLTGWERVEKGQHYYYFDRDTNIAEDSDIYHNIDDVHYQYCNYFSTREKAEEVRKEQELYRRMKKFYDIEDNKVDWNNSEPKYYIIYDHGYKRYEILEGTVFEKVGMIHFSSKKLAQRCINEVIKPFLGA